MSTPSPLRFPTLLQQFFVQRLMHQRQASPRTIAAYRDSLRLLLAFTQRRLGKAPSNLTLQDLNPPLILDFLQYLEVERHNCVRSRNTRFAAIRSFMEYVSFQEPSVLALVQVSAGYSHETLRAAPRRIPLARAHRGNPRRAVATDVDRATGPRDARHALQHRCPGLGVVGDGGARPHPWVQRMGSHSRQGPQGKSGPPFGLTRLRSLSAGCKLILGDPNNRFSRADPAGH